MVEKVKNVERNVTISKTGDYEYDVFSEYLKTNADYSNPQHLTDVIYVHGVNSDITRRFLVACNNYGIQENLELAQNLPMLVAVYRSGEFLNNSRYFRPSGFAERLREYEKPKENKSDFSI